MLTAHAAILAAATGTRDVDDALVAVLDQLPSSRPQDFLRTV
ncbi:hypothetical protein [Streptomyces sp. NPDC006334]